MHSRFFKFISALVIGVAFAIPFFPSLGQAFFETSSYSEATDQRDIDFLKSIYSMDLIYNFSEADLKSMESLEYPQGVITDLRQLNKLGSFDLALVKKTSEERFLWTIRDNPQTLSLLKKYGLSLLEGHAISLYSQSTYSPVNRSLRSQNPSPDVLAFTNYLNASLDKLPKFSGKVKRSINPFDRWDQIYKKNRTVVEKAFTSTSADLNLGLFSHYKITMFIESIEGRDISDFSTNKREKEILFKAGTQFLVTDVILPSNPDDNIQIFLQELP